MGKSKKKFVSLRFKMQRSIVQIVALPLVVLVVAAYLFNARMLSDQIEQSNVVAVNKTALAVESLIDSLKNDSLSLYPQSSVYGYLNADAAAAPGDPTIQLGSYLSGWMPYNNYITELHLIRMDGQSFHYGAAYIDLTDAQKEQCTARNGRLTFVGNARSPYSRTEGAYIFARTVKDMNNLSRTLGYLQMIVPKAAFTKLLDSGDGGKTRNLLVQGDTVIIASDAAYTGHTLEELFGTESWSQQEEVQKRSLQGEEVLTLIHPLDYADWYLVSCMPVVGIGRQQQLVSLVILMVSICVVLLIVCTILGHGVSNMVLRPLTTVADSMKDLEKKNYDLTIPEEGNDETTILAHSFNKMSARIHELLNDVYLFQLREKEAQIKALQAYINPHFLYNTFDTICWMSRMEGAEETGRLVEALSRLLRATIQVEKRVGTVSDELEYTHSYLMIQECRYSDRIDFQLDTEPGLENCETVNFVLQPLIENAIVHGIEPKADVGQICIHIFSREDRLIFTVMDDGTSGDAEEISELIRTYKGGKRGMAIAGLHNRIQLCYGPEYGLHFENNASGGLIATVTQPLKRLPDPEQ